MICTSLLFTAGVAITLVLNFYCLLVGRFIMGVCVGSYVTISPMFVSEIAPVSISGTLGALNQFMASVGVLFAVSLSFMLPYASDPLVLTSELWIVIFAFPALASIVQFLAFVFIFRYDTPKFYQDQDSQENLAKIMACIYDGNLESKGKVD